MKVENYGQLAEDKVNEFEAKWELKIPNDFKMFLLENNGGKVIDGVITLTELNEDVLLDCFYGIGLSVRTKNIDYWMNEFLDEYPPCTVIIGDTADDNMLLYIEG